MAGGRVWTVPEDALVRGSSPADNREVAKRLLRSVRAVEQRRHVLGVTTPARRWRPVEDRLLERALPVARVDTRSVAGQSPSLRLAKKLDRTVHAVELRRYRLRRASRSAG